ncbi:MAG: alcohol dehydrogenase catalytic domain-containing protein [bacterium]|nr:alcohol dehydrogenase catalytic domain-containing protein [bacterium]
MHALRLTESGLVADNCLPIPTPSESEALIRVSLAGICSTDLEIAKGYFGFRGILGHEFVGTVERTQAGEWLGKRVVCSINFADLETQHDCRFGREHHPNRQVLGILEHDGAMADYVCVPVANLLEVPASVADREAVFTEPLAAALRICQQLTIDPDATICVIGPGRLGLLVAQVLSLTGGAVTVAGRSSASLELPNRMGIPTSMTEALADSSFDIVVDTTGNPDGLRLAIRLTRPLGQLVLKSTYAGAAEFDLTKIVVDEIRLIGSRCGPFAPALRLLASKRVDVVSLIDAEYSIQQALQAFQHAALPGMRKVLLTF